jgi:hypothetical protein
MAKPLFFNNKSFVITHDVKQGSTEITVHDAQGINLTDPETYIIATIIPSSGYGDLEIVHITATNGNIFTIERGKEGTSDQIHPYGSVLEFRITSDLLNSLFTRFEEIEDEIDEIEDKLEFGFETENTQTVNLSGLGTEASPLTADVRVSGVSGNLLQVRGDGLAVIEQSPAELATQYVSEDGDDTNPGTRLLPLRTVDRALARIAGGPQVGAYYIYLHSGHSFEIRTPRNLRSTSIIFQSYGDPAFNNAELMAPPGYYWWSAPDYNRPTLSWISRDASAGVNSTVITVSGRVDFYGININLLERTPSIPGAANYLIDSEVSNIMGCNLNYLFSNTCTLVCSWVRLSATVINYNDLLPSVYFGQLRNTTFAFDTDDIHNRPYSGTGYPTFTGRLGNARSISTPDNLQRGGTYNSTTKTMFGWGATWDVFET